MSQFCERKSTWVYESNARAQVLCSGVWTWAIPGSLRKPHLPLEKVTVDALPMSVSASVPSRVPGWMSALPACLSQTATGGSGTTSEVSVWAIGHVHMKTFSAGKPPWPWTVFLCRVFSNQPLLLDFDFGERAGGLGGSEDLSKIHCTFDNTSFQPEWTKGLLESQPSRSRQPSAGSLARLP